ncbi:MAG: helix-turn-helix transcriptional regulator [Anaerocolumna sp.]
MIAVTNCGHDSRHRTKFQIQCKNGVPNYILLLVKTEAFFDICGTIKNTKPNMIIIFDKNTYTHYGCEKDYYNDDWIHFDFIEEESLVETLQLPLNQPIYLPYIITLSNYVRILVQESHGNSIHNAPHHQLSIDHIAESVHMSPSYFQHLYKNIFHISCIQEVIHARIERAKFYLTTTDMTIKTLSEFCGYKNELHFARQFKKKVGLTPSQYRELTHSY